MLGCKITLDVNKDMSWFNVGRGGLLFEVKEKFGELENKDGNVVL